MKIVFFLGVRKSSKDGPCEIFFARTPFGVLAAAGDNESALVIEDAIEQSDEVCELDGTGLDEECVTALAARALGRGYLDNPAVRANGEALLFIIVNEAIQEMGSIQDVDSHV